MSGGQYRVESYAAEPTPHNAINEKAIVDAEAVGEAIRRAVKRSGAKSRLAAIAISGDAAITKVIQMPKSLGEKPFHFLRGNGTRLEQSKQRIGVEHIPAQCAA